MSASARPVAVLFARADSVYKTLPGVDVYDAQRDARTYAGPWPVVAHPPCARWSMLNAVVLSKYPHKSAEYAWGNDGGLFEFALATVRRFGGVLEHPAQSRAFRHYGLPFVGRGLDTFGGWSCEVKQVDWGHRAEKRTWLYIVGAGPDELPPRPATGNRPTARVSRMATCGKCDLMGRAEREHTPRALAEWLLDLARRTQMEEPQ